MNTQSKSLRRILIVDDHPIVRLGIRQMLAGEADLSICGEADTAETALRLTRDGRPDLAIVDLSLGAINGLELIGRLRDAAPGTPVLVLSMHDELLLAERALRAGARGYIMKREAVRGLLGAVRHVLAGKIYVSEIVSQRLLGRLGGAAPSPGALFASLTNREFEVFELIGHGLTTSEIAGRLDVSVKTIETYQSNIKRKLELKNARELLRHATSWTQGL